MSASTDAPRPRALHHLALLLSRRNALAALILALALGLRLGHVLDTPYEPRYDARSYLTMAAQVAHSGDYGTSSASGHGAGGTRGPSAYFPPAYAYLLGAIDVLDGHRDRSAAAMHGDRIAQALLGTVTVALIALIALELFGPVTALAAATLAAVYPVLIELTGLLVAENLMTTLILGAVLCCVRATLKQTILWSAVAGTCAGLAALAHENALVCLIPLAYAAARAGGRRALLALLAGAVLAIAPWTLRNLLVMHHFIPISDETGITLVGTYNPASAANPQVPYKWRFFAAIPGERRRVKSTGKLSEPELSSRLEHQALTYIVHHPLAPAAAAAANTARMLELEGEAAWLASASAQGLSASDARRGVIAFWILGLLALAGCFTTAVRRAPRWLWWLPLLLALSIVLVNVETPRFRAPIDPFLILLAACAATALLRRAPVVGQRRPARAAGRAELVDVVEGEA